jgi:Na+/proline symporter
MDAILQNWPVIAVLLAYLAGCLAVGRQFQQRAARGASDYYVAKRQIPGWVV